jgi:hypothetical protein
MGVLKGKTPHCNRETLDEDKPERVSTSPSPPILLLPQECRNEQYEVATRFTSPLPSVIEFPLIFPTKSSFSSFPSLLLLLFFVCLFGSKLEIKNKSENKKICTLQKPAKKKQECAEKHAATTRRQWHQTGAVGKREREEENTGRSKNKNKMQREGRVRTRCVSPSPTPSYQYSVPPFPRPSSCTNVSFLQLLQTKSRRFCFAVY